MPRSMFVVAAAMLSAMAIASSSPKVLQRHVAVDSTTMFQEVLGPGAAMTGSSAYNLMKLPSSQRRDLLHRLFDEGSSASSAVPGGFRFLRISMGACDFSLKNYSYDDLPDGVTTDYDLEYFNVSYDDAFIVPALLEVLRVRPDIRIVAAPWSPPGWMKNAPYSMNGGSLRNDSARLYRTYAKYFRLFVEAYAQRGIPIYAISMQNEPRYGGGDYPTCVVTWEQERILAPLISREFKTSPIIQGRTGIIVYDHNWDDADYPIEVLTDPVVHEDPLVLGSAFHCYGGDVTNQSTVHDAFPDKRLFFTECSGGAWSPSFSGDLIWDVQTLVIGAVKNWAEIVLKWNLILDENAGPKLPWGCMDCRGVVTTNFSVVDPTTGNVALTFNEDFYSLAALGVLLPGRGSSSSSLTTSLHRVGTPRRVASTSSPMGGSDVLAMVHKEEASAPTNTSFTVGSVILVNADPNSTAAFNVSWQSDATHSQSAWRCDLVFPVSLPPLSVASAQFRRADASRPSQSASPTASDNDVVNVRWWLSMGTPAADGHQALLAPQTPFTAKCYDR